MLYHIAHRLVPYAHGLNVIHYVSFRAIAALLTSLLFSFIFGSWFIEKSKLFFRAKAREWTPETHKVKDDLPTMGGIFIIATVLVTALLWANWDKATVWLFIGALLANGAIGFWDDWYKIRRRKGISARAKFVAQLTVAFVCAVIWLLVDAPSTTVTIPFFKNWNPDLGWFFIAWFVLVMVGTSNAVNLTDGLDGLAMGSLIPNFATFAIVCYLAGHIKLAEYLHIPFADSAEITVLGATLVGASLGFLWYNTYPAPNFHGGCGFTCAGQRTGLHGAPGQTRAALAHCRWSFCRGSTLGDHSSLVLPPLGHPHFPHGTHSPPL